ncbi:MAG TPA: hypothetical protein VFE32_00155 [Puia sp.]|jgi:hypothetical protein|nr:hypothetical protein [Puia sp.]
MNRSTYTRLASLAALSLLAITLSHCKKSNSSGNGNNGNGSGYYFKFKLNGASVEYDSEPVAELSPTNSEGLYSAALIAYQNVNAGSKNAITILAYSSNTIAANVPYNDPSKATEANGAPVPQSTVFWYDSTGVSYLTAGEFADASGNIPIAGMVANSKLTITDLTSTYLKGTFSGTVYNAGNLSASITITDGEFYLKREP